MTSGFVARSRHANLASAVGISAGPDRSPTAAAGASASDHALEVGQVHALVERVVVRSVVAGAVDHIFIPGNVSREHAGPAASSRRCRISTTSAPSKASARAPRRRRHRFRGVDEVAMPASSASIVDTDAPGAAARRWASERARRPSVVLARAPAAGPRRPARVGTIWFEDSTTLGAIEAEDVDRRRREQCGRRSARCPSSGPRRRPPTPHGAPPR